ncbi:hypothetical protein, unlikely [Trypanosoma brucei brucei TREU927]|uniref:Uncharacterized protein n=1 Tax=Trypanosoma brucei brucei (strain 927/4 GUTat10.1) TaxID=185431 RepID=Q4GZ74_TRYB2|nr:hypothetical protein, unlikely [Trypanosoma brucei brucei TREU927]CAJ16116.1 hypothetical protein, unlikely [Trypanosoma brucei brucei TREU927]
MLRIFMCMFVCACGKEGERKGKERKHKHIIMRKCFMYACTNNNNNNDNCTRLCIEYKRTYSRIYHPRTKAASM